MGCSSAFCSTTVGSNKTVELVRRSLTLAAPLSTLPSPILDCFSRPAFAEQQDIRIYSGVLLLYDFVFLVSVPVLRLQSSMMARLWLCTTGTAVSVCRSAQH